MGKVVPFRKPRRTSRWTQANSYVSAPRRRARKGGWFPFMLVGVPLAAFFAVLLLPLGGGPEAALGAGPMDAPRSPVRTAAEIDAEQPDIAALSPAPGSLSGMTGGGGGTVRAALPLCAGPIRVTCVVDGDTIWYKGEKIRLADLDAPEVFSPACPREAELGRRATARLQALLAAGPFTLEPNPVGRARDRYGHTLMVATRGGESIGARLVAEGLAERWGGPRVEWC